MLNVNSNQLNQSKIKNIEDGAKGSGFFFFFFYCKRRSEACCVVGFSCSKLWSRTSSEACCVAAASSHVSEPKSSEACCIATSKLRSRTSSGACWVAAASSHVPELTTATQQALTLRSRKAPKLIALQQALESDKLRSLLRCSSKLSRSGAWSLLASSNKTNKNKIKNKHFT